MATVLPAAAGRPLEDDLAHHGIFYRDGPGLLFKEGRVMAWIYLLLAGLLEVVWAYSMKLSEGFSKPVPTTITVITITTMQMRSLPLGVLRPTKNSRWMPFVRLCLS